MEIPNNILKEGTDMGYSETVVREIWKLFGVFDQENTGSVQQTEVMAILQSFGQNPTPDEVEKIIQKTQKKGNQKITFLEFLRHTKDFIKNSDTLKDELKNAFLAFDAEKTGFISQNELKDILTSLGDRLDDEEINEMFMLVDVDNEGRINYEGFIKQFVIEK